VHVWRPLAKKSTANQLKEHNVEKYIPWITITTLSLTIRLYRHSSSCWLQNVEIPQNSPKIRTYSIIQETFAAGLYLSISVACSRCYITPKQHVRVLGVVISADHSLEKHVTNVSATCFHHLRRLRHIRRMLTAESAATLFVHAFVTSRVDYCNVVLAGAPKVITNKLQRVMNAAIRVLTGTRKFDRGLTQLMRPISMAWSAWARHKVIILTRRCLIGTALRYLAADCVSDSEMVQRHHTLYRWSSARRAVVPSELMWPSGVFCTMQLFA